MNLKQLFPKPNIKNPLVGVDANGNYGYFNSKKLPISIRVLDDKAEITEEDNILIFTKPDIIQNLANATFNQKLMLINRSEEHIFFNGNFDSKEKETIWLQSNYKYEVIFDTALNTWHVIGYSQAYPVL